MRFANHCILFLFYTVSQIFWNWGCICHVPPSNEAHVSFLCWEQLDSLVVCDPQSFMYNLCMFPNNSVQI